MPERPSLRLLKYIKEISEIRHTLVHRIDQYEEVLWLKDLPSDVPKEICFTRAWEADNEADDSDIWLRLKKWKKPRLSRIPPKCREWINEEELNNDARAPLIRKKITSEHDNPDAPDVPDPPNNVFEDEFEEPQKIICTKYLQGYQEVSDAWHNFIDQKWEPWSDLHKQWKNNHKFVDKIYSQLDSIYNKQQIEREEYELVLGVGLLQWRINESTCKRHIIVADVDINFDPRRGEFTISPSMNPTTDQAAISSEFDMLSLENRPNQNAIKKQLTECDDILNENQVEKVLDIVVHTLNQGDCDYQPNNFKFRTLNEIENRPVIDFAPALILRRRNTRSIRKVIDNISEQIKENNNIPRLFANLSGEQNEIITWDPQPQDQSVANNTNSTENGITYFPLLSNTEQEKILQSANSNSGILVQGPPGTGKSHAIANLICHFLATGKRILITAKTPNALKVLKDKLPDSIQPLCINLLGRGDDQMDLEKSVESIVQKEEWNDEEDEKLSQAVEDRDQLKRKEAELSGKLKNLRKSECEPHEIYNTGYQGTLAKIAMQINKEKEKYEWFTDEVQRDQSCPFEGDKIRELWQNIQELTDIQKQELELIVPILEQGCPVVDRQEFSRLMREEQQNENNYDDNLYQILLDVDNIEVVRNIVNKSQELINAKENILKIQLPQTETIVSNILSGNDDMRYKHLFDKFPDETKIKELSERADRNENIDFEFPENIENKLLNDAKNRSNHFKNGGKKGFLVFAPKIIRKTRYIEKKIRVNGQWCKTQELLEKVIDHLELQKEISSYISLWHSIVNPERTNQISNDQLSLQILEIRKHRKILEQILELCNYRKTAKEAVDQINGIDRIAWHEEEAVAELLVACSYYISEKATQRINKIQEYLETFLRQENPCYSLVQDLLNAVSERDINLYQSILDKINHFKKINSDYISLRNKSTLIAEMIKNDCEENIEQKINQIEEAWKWAKAKCYLENYYNKDPGSIERNLKRIIDEIKTKIEELASLKAWKSFFDRVNKNPETDYRAHLEGWKQAIQRIGRGTGKHAHIHRKDAQEHLNQCKEVIPAWIMPLHKVYETVKVEPQIFDVIIVDEASQCGVESFLLTYLGEKLIIVGDDQQISPAGVAINEMDVQSLRQQYLSDFEHADLFDPKSSLFDYGRRMFRRPVILREHFRCMPEIIAFSNRLCYQNHSLIPLRQYPPERLEPLKAVHVKKGYREGQDSGVFNRPEAEMVVEKIVECCEKPQYKEKTMGVIVLQQSKKQVDIIRSSLSMQLSTQDLEDRQLICGMPNSFQGDERDIIFLSMIADREHTRALTTDLYKKRFNVAASRAKDQMWLIHTVTTDDLSPHCFRRKLLEHFYYPPNPINYGLGDTLENLTRREYEHDANPDIELPRPYESWFELRVALMIADKGYRIIPQYPVAGYRIDLVVGSGQSLLAVECDGEYWHGPDRYGEDIARQRQLERCGWYFYRVKDYMFYGNRELVWNELQTELEARDIHPEPAPDSAHSTDNTVTQVQRRPNMDFHQMGIENGSILKFINDTTVEVEIISNRQVRYVGDVWSLTNITKELLEKPNVSPKRYWTYEGKSLEEIYKETYNTPG